LADPNPDSPLPLSRRPEQPASPDGAGWDATLAARIAALADQDDQADGEVAVGRADGSFARVCRVEGGPLVIEYCDLTADQSRRSLEPGLSPEQARSLLSAFRAGRRRWHEPLDWVDAGPLPAPPGEAWVGPPPANLPAPGELIARQRYRDVRRAGWVTFAVAINAGACWVLAVYQTGVARLALACVGLSLTVTAVSMDRLARRCPRCNRWLGLRLARPSCPHCRLPLQRPGGR
jgi:hypothetical protein